MLPLRLSVYQCMNALCGVLAAQKGTAHARRRVFIDRCYLLYNTYFLFFLSPVSFLPACLDHAERGPLTVRGVVSTPAADAAVPPPSCGASAGSVARRRPARPGRLERRVGGAVPAAGVRAGLAGGGSPAADRHRRAQSRGPLQAPPLTSRATRRPEPLRAWLHWKHHRAGERGVRQAAGPSRLCL